MTTSPRRPNVLLVTLDQFRGDCLSLLGHKVVRTPNLDALAKESVTFARHYSQAAPCSPGRASLYTGTYQMNHRVCFNGSPLDDRFDNVARLGRRLDYAPALFGYTDQGVDPRTTSSADDPRLSTYQGVLPGFDWILDLSEPYTPWLAHLRSNGHDFDDHIKALMSEPDRDESLSISTFLTDAFLSWLDGHDGNDEHVNAKKHGAAKSIGTPWFAHLSYLRPHPPYTAAGRWSRAYDPADVDMPLAPSNERHGFHEAVMQLPDTAAPRTEAGMRKMRAQYYGMIGEVDHNSAEWSQHCASGASGTTPSSSSLPTMVNSWATMGCEKRWASSSRVTTSSAWCAHRGTVSVTVESSTRLPRMSTSSPRCVNCSAPRHPHNATVARSCHGWPASPLVNGARWRRGNTTGVSSTSLMQVTVLPSTGRMIVGSSARTCACSSTLTLLTCNSATATGWHSISPATRRGAHPSPTLHMCCRSRNACSRGDHSTRSGASRE